MASSHTDTWLNDIEDLAYVSESTWLMCEEYQVNYNVKCLPENGWF